MIHFLEVKVLYIKPNMEHSKVAMKTAEKQEAESKKIRKEWDKKSK